MTDHWDHLLIVIGLLSFRGFVAPFGAHWVGCFDRRALVLDLGGGLTEVATNPARDHSSAISDHAKLSDASGESD